MKKLFKTRSIASASVYLIALTLLFSASCQRIELFEGPDLIEIYGDFTVLEDFSASQSSVDFSTNESVYFTARFSTITNWTLEITSDESESVKIIEGRSKELTASNALWDGTTSKFPVFQPGKCTATLFLEGDSSEHSLTIDVTGSRQPEGLLIADFEGNLNPAWRFFVQSGADMSFRIESKVPAPVGGKYFDMGGTVNWDWLIGMFDIPNTAMNGGSFGLPNNPDDVYFNAVVYRPDSLPNGFLLLRFSEDDNGDGKFNESNEDQYAVEFRDFEPGWHIISFKYSDLEYLINGAPADPKGNGVRNPDKLNMVSCLFLANPASGYAQVLMDEMIFTVGGPLKL